MAGIRHRRPGLSQLPARHPGMDGRENPELVRNFVAATSRGFHAAAADQAATLALLARVIPYQPAWRLERSLELVATSWFHDGLWGVQREADLIAGYAAWLAGQRGAGVGRRVAGRDHQ